MIEQAIPTETVGAIVRPTATTTGDGADLHDGDTAPLDQWRITVNLRAEANGPVIGREVITRHDLVHVLTETWFHGCLRRGLPDFPLPKFEPMLQPLYRDEGGQLIGRYILSVARPDGQMYRRKFTPWSIPYGAERAAHRLIAAGQLRQGDVYYYEIEVQPSADAAAVDTAATAGAAIGDIKLKQKDPPLSWLIVPLDDLLPRATAVGEHDKRWCYTFYTKRARQRLEQLARLGMQQTPAVETGAALVGTLCICPRSHDMFVIVTDALPVQDAQEAEMSLALTAPSWQRITTVIEAMQRQPALATMRLLGQGHGHNFMPANGAQPCEVCAKAEVCGRTSVFVSTEDLDWMRCVFTRQPFALSHIFGLSARHKRPDPDEVEGLYGMSDGRLLPRAYHVIEEFDPARYEQGQQRKE